MTQRVHVFLKTLKTNFKEKAELSFFNDLTAEATNRKQAASVFYSCLLLAKENTILVNQDKSYGDITLRKGKLVIPSKQHRCNCSIYTLQVEGISIQLSVYETIDK